MEEVYGGIFILKEFHMALTEPMINVDDNIALLACCRCIYGDMKRKQRCSDAVVEKQLPPSL